MPTYKVTQKQGNRTMTSTIEAKSLASLKAFLDQISTAKPPAYTKFIMKTTPTHRRLMILTTLNNLKQWLEIKTKYHAKFYYTI